MKLNAALVSAALLASVDAVPTVDESYPYTGPDTPVGDWVNPTVKGNGKGYPRLVEPPAVKPSSDKPTNNINVVSLSYAGDGVNIHYQTPFGLDGVPAIKWGRSADALSNTATGASHSCVKTLLGCAQSSRRG